MSPSAARYVVFTEGEQGPVCGLDEQTIAAAGGVVRCERAGDQNERIRIAQDAEVLVVSSAPITREFLVALPGLKGVTRLGVGVDSVDLQAATDLGVVVTNAAGFCLEEVAEHTVGLILTMVRKITLADRMTRRGEWVPGVQAKMLPIRRLSGQTLGMVGFGQIAQTLAGKARALGLEVIASDPYVAPKSAERKGVRLAPLEELLSQADIVSLHVPLTAETRHLINRETLALMKPTAILINTARGPVVDSAALEQALAAGRLAGAGLDVLEQEPPKLPHPLLKFDNVVVACHYGSCSLEAYANLRQTVSKQAADILRGNFPKNIVNPQVKNQPHCRLRS
jgi:D-3-phosphoglycerate dehydrogenase / 2-oxoglutarate reductase